MTTCSHPKCTTPLFWNLFRGERKCGNTDDSNCCNGPFLWPCGREQPAVEVVFVEWDREGSPLQEHAPACRWPQCMCVFVYVSSSVTSALGGELGLIWERDKPQAISLDVDSGAGFPWKWLLVLRELSCLFRYDVTGPIGAEWFFGHLKRDVKIFLPLYSSGGCFFVFF